MIEQARKIFDSYEPEPRFSGRRPTGNSGSSGGGSPGSSLREKLMFAIERKKLSKTKGKPSMFDDGGRSSYGDDGIYY